jgi:hypothetical protein
VSRDWQTVDADDPATLEAMYARFSAWAHQVDTCVLRMFWDAERGEPICVGCRQRSPGFGSLRIWLGARAAAALQASGTAFLDSTPTADEAWYTVCRTCTAMLRARELSSVSSRVELMVIAAHQRN